MASTIDICVLQQPCWDMPQVTQQHLPSALCQSSFLAHEQRSHQPRVGIGDWICGGEVKVGDAGGIRGRGAVLHLPGVGEGLPWTDVRALAGDLYSVPQRTAQGLNDSVRLTQSDGVRLFLYCHRC